MLLGLIEMSSINVGKHPLGFSIFIFDYYLIMTILLRPPGSFLCLVTITSFLSLFNHPKHNPLDTICFDTIFFSEEYPIQLLDSNPSIHFNDEMNKSHLLYMLLLCLQNAHKEVER